MGESMYISTLFTFIAISVTLLFYFTADNINKEQFSRKNTNERESSFGRFEKVE